MNGFTPHPTKDGYTYTYKCGHEFFVTGTMMVRGGQVAPPLCPECYGQKVVDQMEAENWRKDPNWNGWAVGQVAGSAFAKQQITPTGYKTWMELELRKVRDKAWH